MPLSNCALDALMSPIGTQRRLATLPEFGGNWSEAGICESCRLR
jgi:hypothetical protein